MSASSNDRFSLCNKTILITGRTGGIGEAISLRFARSGAKGQVNVALQDRQAAGLPQTPTSRVALALNRFRKRHTLLGRQLDVNSPSCTRSL
jgi:NAD(P)-dependent dehydrogenase (short-subunit alcohol dehydrogenase family)